MTMNLRRLQSRRRRPRSVAVLQKTTMQSRLRRRPKAGARRRPQRKRTSPTQKTPQSNLRREAGRPRTLSSKKLIQLWPQRLRKARRPNQLPRSIPTRSARMSRLRQKKLRRRKQRPRPPTTTTSRWMPPLLQPRSAKAEGRRLLLKWLSHRPDSHRSPSITGTFYYSGERQVDAAVWVMHTRNSSASGRMNNVCMNVSRRSTLPCPATSPL